MKDPHGDRQHGGRSRAIGRRRLVRTVRAYVGLGANLGDAKATLAAAVNALASMPGVRLVAVSRLYRTTPVGVVDQPEFLNAVVALDVPAGPNVATGAGALLVALKQLERAFGRKQRVRWGPRELDLDLLVFGRARVEIDAVDARLSLVVPHPEARNRLFVLAPLADLAPHLAPPSWGETVESARARREREEGSDTVVSIGTWDPATAAWLPQA